VDGSREGDEQKGGLAVVVLGGPEQAVVLEEAPRVGGEVQAGRTAPRLLVPRLL
jgi:hypothetical protein